MNKLPCKLEYSTTEINRYTSENITPNALARAIVNIEELDSLANPRILDIGANTGRFCRFSRERWPHAHIIGIEQMFMPAPEWVDEWYIGDFLDYRNPIRYNDRRLPPSSEELKPTLCIGNIPYNKTVFVIDEFDYLVVGEKGKPKETKIPLVEPIIRHSLSLLKDGGWLAFLLLQQILGSRERWWADGEKRTVPGLWQEFPPVSTYTITPRPSFRKEDPRSDLKNRQTTDAREYCVVVMQKGYKGKTEQKWLDWEYDENL